MTQSYPELRQGEALTYDQLLDADRETARTQLGPEATRVEVDLTAEALFARRYGVIPEVGQLATKNSR